MRKKTPYGFIVYLTNYCKLRCRHCFWVQNNKINTEYIPYNEVCKMIDTMAENKIFMIAYTGGDPLLHPDIFKILQYTRKKNILPLLGISGIDMTEEIADKIYNSGVRCVQVSLDDVDRKYNDYMRGESCFKYVDECINILQHHNINVNLAICLNKYNYKNLFDMLQYAYQKNIYEVKIQFWKKFNKDYKVERIEELDQEKKQSVINMCRLYEKEVGRVKWISLPIKNDEVMPFSRAHIIDTNGDIKYNEQSEVIGNIYNGGLEYIINDEKREKAANKMKI